VRNQLFAFFFISVLLTPVFRCRPVTILYDTDSAEPAEGKPQKQKWEKQQTKATFEDTEEKPPVDAMEK
jgi:hypothetical protein